MAKGCIETVNIDIDNDNKMSDWDMRLEYSQQRPDWESDLNTIQELSFTDVKAVYEEAVPLNLN
jgi:hypothetical protein